MYDNLDQDEHATQEVEVTSKRRRAVALVGAGLLLLGVGAVSVKTSQLSKQTASLRAASKAPAVKSFSKPGDYARDVSTCTSAERGPVLKGYDVVAYFDLNEGEPGVHGKEEIYLKWGGYTWLFSTTVNREKFRANPTKFMPQYGGFCSYGISHESQWTSTNLGPNTNPDTWQILHGKLYMFMYGLPMGEFMDGEVESEIENADKRWSDWFDGDGDGSTTVIMNTGCMWYCDKASAEIDDEVFDDCESPDDHLHDVAAGNVQGTNHLLQGVLPKRR